MDVVVVHTDPNGDHLMRPGSVVCAMRTAIRVFSQRMRTLRCPEFLKSFPSVLLVSPVTPVHDGTNVPTFTTSSTATHQATNINLIMFPFRFTTALTRRLATPSARAFLSTSGNSRPFRVLGLQQVAIGCIDKSPLEQLWKGIFGLEASATKTIETENVEEDIVKLGVPPFEVEIDLMRPIDPEKSPKVHVPPLNHLGLWIDDLPAAVKWMEEQGVRFTPGGIRKGAAGHNVVFIHPKGNEKAPIGGAGVLIELVQAPPEVVEAFKN